ncbi:MAG: hypothetical protein IPJ16_14710 [Bacteroidales bacterium]|nr:hypothetical protein [Bacteroidales bacterium]
MYLFDWLARISASIGVLILFIGVMSVLTKSNILGLSNLVNYFQVANTFFIFTIVLLLHKISHKKD